MHGTILTTQPDPCSCALCRVNKLYRFYDRLEVAQPPRIPYSTIMNQPTIDWNLARLSGRQFWFKDEPQ